MQHYSLEMILAIGYRVRREITEDMKAFLPHLDVRVVDHLIVGGNGYFSFAREALLNG